MNTSNETYKQAIHNLSVANMLRIENQIIFLMCEPKGYKGCFTAKKLYDIHYQLRVGEIDYNDPLEELKRDVAYSMLSFMIKDLGMNYRTINYWSFVMEVERSFWNSENWNMKPYDFAKKYISECSIYEMKEFYYYFRDNNEEKAINYIVDLVKRMD